MHLTRPSRRCPKTGRVIPPRRWNLPTAMVVLCGGLATLWYLLRVLPKPSRAAYPCQTAAAPLRWALIGALGLSVLSGTSLVWARRWLSRARHVLAALAFAGFAAGVVGLIAQHARPAAAAFVGCEADGEVATRPIGVARGIHPGRVVWVHDPAVAAFEGTGNWWDPAVNDQAAADEMVRNVARHLAGRSEVAAAWDAIFRWFNGAHGRGATGYVAGERVAVKINQNNQQQHASNNDINGNPALILALIRSLVEDAGVPEASITVFDASRAIGNSIYDPAHAAYPGVVFVDHFGGDGRVKSTYESGAIHYSANNGALATGLATAATEATYLVNLAILKGHVGQGVTFGAKNMYGMTSISNDYRQNAHDNFNPSGGCAPRYMTFTDWMAHKDMGEKTMLWLMDAVYPTYALNGTPSERWDLAPFNGDWPSSVFASLDGVANDSVSIDFYRARWNDAPDLAYADQYLHEAALADAPPSGTFYDPDGDGIRAPSLGVHEHWNNPTDKQYSRNLGTGEGIELVYVGPSSTPALCGDGACDADETCSTCEADCGPCDGAGGATGTGGSGTGTGAAGSGGSGGSLYGGAPAAGLGGAPAATGGSATMSGGMAPFTGGSTGVSGAAATASERDAGCACRVGPAGRPDSGAPVALLLACVLLLRRRSAQEPA